MRVQVNQKNKETAKLRDHCLYESLNMRLVKKGEMGLVYHEVCHRGDGGRRGGGKEGEREGRITNQEVAPPLCDLTLLC